MKEDWDDYWKNSKITFFGKTLSLVRKQIIANRVASIFETYFPKQGKFIDCGCGSAETMIKIKRYNREIIALDYSEHALEKVRNNKSLPVSSTVKADIFDLPFKDNSIGGIWNLGVMEHFSPSEINKILDEFYRVLKKDSYCILLWPSIYGPTNIIFSILGFILRKQFFPNEPSLLRSKSWLKNILKNNKFKLVKVDWPLSGALIYHEVILR